MKKKITQYPVFWIDIALLIIIIILGVFIIYKSRTPMTIDDYTINNATIAEKDSSANYFEDSNNNKTLEEWQEVNPEVTFLLKINGKEFPVLYGPHDSSYYLDHDVFGEYDIFGSVYLEPSTIDINTDSKIIYGHSTYNSDLMFSFIANYKDPDYYEENKTFIFETPTGEHTYVVLALMEIEDSQNPEDMAWLEPNLLLKATEASLFYQTFIRENTVYLFSNTVSPDKPFIELITCKMATSVEESVGRYVLLAQQVD